MKKLFLAAALALLMPCTISVYAADAPPTKADLEKEFLKFEKKAEKDSKDELKGLVSEDVLKKELKEAREQQGDRKNPPMKETGGSAD